ncbi:MAG TPA: SWIM zinc finger family protein [Longimicrobiaceae bacterium]|nr:SWIM zinc finger family protein [Longimicrobiaceae bacterium]
MLDSGMANKIYKAKQYAEQPERIHFESLRVRIEGVNNEHRVEFDDGHWKCDCEYFRNHATCSHVMALERILGVMAPHEEEEEPQHA